MGRQRVLAWGALVSGMILCRAPYLENVFYNIDEAEYAVAADALAHGWLPGADLLGSTKPPGAPLLCFVLFEIFGRSLTVLHVAQTGFLILGGWFLFELAVALWGAGAAVPAAVLFVMLANSYGLPAEMFSLNVETPGMALTTLALLLTWKWNARPWAALAAGAAFGAAVLFRQSFLVFALPLALGLARAPLHARTSQGAYSVAGLALIWIPLVIVYAAAGKLAWAWDSWVRYPITYAADLAPSAFVHAFVTNGGEFVQQATVPLGLALLGVWEATRERSPRTVFLWCLLAASAVALAAGSRFWGHYWIQTYPAFVLFGTLAWRKFAAGRLFVRLALAAAIVAGLAVAAWRFPLWRVHDPAAPPRGVPYARLDDEATDLNLGLFAQANTRPDETIVVWGYCPQIYYYAQRLPGVRDYLCHYITGYSPGAFDPAVQRAPRAYGHVHAEELFLEDLQRRQPKYVFDLVPIENYYFTFLNYSLRSYPGVAEYLWKHYLPEGQIGGAHIYRRRTETDTWWPTPADIE